ncbi:hypothetical protein [Actinomyces sp. MRS3W]|uniref:hypothetical protein n=1 Tax=Actinomyces sp. MRS3W TaxID=2800796 RepID=UPI0028FD3B07|nr:hypothetical protein [Actinomyces sp. MRS3W]MDU0347256.1 hypothetical protein [Actinomyces sp. MRS3W]
MARHGSRSSKRPYGAGHRPLDMSRLESLPRTQTGPGGAEFTVRRVRGGAKTYICPGCNQTISAGTPHVVAWSNESLFGPERGLEERRHWHTSCWERGLW